MARDRVAFMLSDNGLLLEAKACAEKWLADARTESQNLKEEADAYSAEVLTHLEHTLDTSLAQVRRGLERLRYLAVARSRRAAT
jgi:hypothetical protein